MHELHENESRAKAKTQTKGVLSRSAGFVARHPAGTAQAIAGLLIAIVVLQNIEPTSLDLLFWSAPDIPKLVLILGSMLVGGVIWELLRARLTRRSRA